MAGVSVGTHYALMITVAATTLCWMLTAFLGPQTDRRTLAEFYRKVRPFGPGWKAVRREAGMSEDEARSTSENFPLSLVGWISGVAAIWSSLFAVGNILYGRWGSALVCLAVFVVSGLALIKVMNRIWGNSRAAGTGA